MTKRVLTMPLVEFGWMQSLTQWIHETGFRWVLKLQIINQLPNVITLALFKHRVQIT